MISPTADLVSVPVPPGWFVPSENVIVIVAPFPYPVLIPVLSNAVIFDIDTGASFRSFDILSDIRRESNKVTDFDTGIEFLDVDTESEIRRESNNDLE